MVQVEECKIEQFFKFNIGYMYIWKGFNFKIIICDECIWYIMLEI